MDPTDDGGRALGDARSGWLVFPHIRSEYDDHGRLHLVEDDEAVVMVSLSPDDAPAGILLDRRDGTALPLGDVAPPRELSAGGSRLYPQGLAGSTRGVVVDRFGYPNRTAESFVAHWLAARLGVDLATMGGADRWGRAAQWPSVANELDVRVDGCAAPGAVAQTSHGFGHVAVVVSVDDGGSMEVEDYDYGLGGEYRLRRIPQVGHRFLHFAPIILR